MRRNPCTRSARRHLKEPADSRIDIDNPTKPPLDRGGFGGRRFGATDAKQKTTDSRMTISRFCGMDGTRTRDLLRDRQAF